MIFEVADTFYFLTFFIASLTVGCFILISAGMCKNLFLLCLLATAFGHFIGSLIHMWLSTFMPSDSISYFLMATPEWRSFGSGFILNVVWYLREYVFGNSMLGVYVFFAFIGTLGSIFYLISFHKLILYFKKFDKLYFNSRGIKFGYFLIACWPSAFIWTSLLGKDTLCYFSISLFFLSLISIINRAPSIISFIILIFSIVLSFLVRPYLVLIGFIAYLCWFFFSKKKHSGILLQVVLVFLVVIGFTYLSHDISEFGGFDYSYGNIVQRALVQQISLAGGSYIPVPTHNPYLLIFFLPYTMLANLFLPLFFWIRNTFGILASIQNVLLLILCYKFFKNRDVWRKIRNNLVIGYMFWYFIAGIGFMGMINTNLGLADREKLMYLPPFLIIIFLTLAIKKVSKKEQLKCVVSQE